MDHPAVEWPAAFADQMIREEGEESDSEELTKVRWGAFYIQSTDFYYSAQCF